MAKQRTVTCPSCASEDVGFDEGRRPSMGGMFILRLVVFYLAKAWWSHNLYPVDPLLFTPEKVLGGLLWAGVVALVGWTTMVDVRNRWVCNSCGHRFRLTLWGKEWVGLYPHRLPFGLAVLLWVLVLPGADRTEPSYWWMPHTGPLKRCLSGHVSLEGDEGYCVRAVAFSPEGRTVVTGANEETEDGLPGNQLALRFWDFPSGNLKSVLSGMDGLVKDLAFSPNGKVLLGTGSFQTHDMHVSRSTPTLLVWDTQGSKPKLSRATGLSIALFLHALSLDGSTAAAEGSAGVYLLYVPTGKLLRTRKIQGLPGGYVFNDYFSPDLKTVAHATFGSEGVIEIWDTGTGAITRRLPSRQDKEPVDAHGYCTFTPDDRLLAVAQEFEKRRPAGSETARTQPPGNWIVPERHEYYTRITVWDVQTGKRKLALPTFPGRANRPCISPDGTILACAIGLTFPPMDQQLEYCLTKLWDTKTGRLMRTLEGYFPRTFSPDGKLLATSFWVPGRSRLIQLWDVNRL